MSERGAAKAGAAADARRRLWEDLWSRRSAPEFLFYLREPPPQLVALLNSGAVQPGAALDVGCGGGVITAFLSQTFHPTVGIDVAAGALEESRRHAMEIGHRPSFVQAEAPALPLGDATLSFMYDRGCLHQVPQERWSAYFREVDRILRPGGVLEILYVNPGRGESRRRLSARGARQLRKLLRWMRTLFRPARPMGTKHPPLDRATVERLLPASIKILTFERFPYRTLSGWTPIFTNCVLRKSAGCSAGWALRAGVAQGEGPGPARVRA